VLVIREPLATSRLMLRPYSADDVDELFAIRSRPDVVRYLYGDPWTRAETIAQLSRLETQNHLTAEGDTLRLAVERQASPGLIGSVSLRWISARDRQGEVGFVIHPQHQGHGYAREAADAMLRLAFDRLDLHKVVGGADARNVASAAVLRRLGLRQEAHLRHHAWLKGEWSDELVFGILAEEWRAAR
jgi:RimJ/RimL family protein N-acetyltransferase